MFTLKKPDPARARAYRFAFHMAWPAVVESFFVSFAGLVDSLMVSSLGSSAAVSYTHLDVYKRQTVSRGRPLFCRSFSSRAANRLRSRMFTAPRLVISSIFSWV